MSLAGTPKKVTLDGTTFDVYADTNITEVASKLETEAIPTSGNSIMKKTRRSTNREGVVIACNGAEFEIVKELSERIVDFSMSYELASGDVYRTVGQLNLESRETEENRCTIIMIPRDDWSAFLA